MAPAAVERLGSERYIRLTTFRRTGEPVGTAVWVVGDGDRLLVWTGADTGKAKRLRHTSRVTVAASDARGRPRGASVPGVGRLLPAAETARVTQLVAAKYGLQYRSLDLLNRAVRVLRRRPASEPVGIEVRLSEEPGGAPPPPA